MAKGRALRTRAILRSGGSMTGTHDDAVTIDDLLYFLVHFENGS